MEKLDEKGKNEQLHKARQNYLFRDRMIKAVTADGQFRVVILKASDLIDTARQKHTLNPLSTSILGELMMGSLLAAASLKGEERITLRIDVHGPVKYGVSEATANGEVRGYLGNGHFLPEPGDPLLMKKKAMGTGTLQMIKVLYNESKPMTSIIEAVESSVVKDLTRYFALSEQIPTAIKMDIQFNEDFSVKNAVALMVQTLPGAEEQDILDLEINLIDTPNLTRLVEEGIYIDEILPRILKNHQIKELSRTPVDFYCRCSKEKFLETLNILSTEELLSLNEKNQELLCHYCNSKYIITQEEIITLLKNRETKI